jgi:hypothetical protein
MVKYCRADVELLSKAILKFREDVHGQLGRGSLQIRHPCQLTACLIYSNKFMPERTIVGNSNTKTSIACKEWLLHLNDKNIVPEVPICVDKRRFSKSFDCHKNKVESKTYFSGKHNFVVDGFDKVNKVVKEFYGCYWHGMPKMPP